VKPESDMTTFYRPSNVVVIGNRRAQIIPGRVIDLGPTRIGRVIAFTIGLLIGLVLGLAARQLRLPGFQSSWTAAHAPLCVAMRVSPPRMRAVTRFLSYTVRNAAGRRQRLHRRKPRRQPRPKFQEYRLGGATWKT